MDKEKITKIIAEYFEIDITKETGIERRFDIVVHFAKDKIKTMGFHFPVGPSTTNFNGYMAHITTQHKAITGKIMPDENQAMASAILKYIDKPITNF